MFRCIVLLMLPASLLAQKELRVNLLTQEALERRLSEFPLQNEARQDRAKALFTELGCPKVFEVPLHKKPYPANVVCVLPGESPKTILVGAHFDKSSKGEGKIDNGSGAVLMSALLSALKAETRRHTLIFVAFAEEELGLRGSEALADKGMDGMKGKEFLATLSAMVNVDSVGAGVTAIALTQSDKDLTGLALAMAKHIQVSCRIVNVDQVGDSDGSSFRKRKVKTVQFHSLDNDNWRILHTEKDNMAALLGKEYFNTYRLIAYYLAQLDFELDR